MPAVSDQDLNAYLAEVSRVGSYKYYILQCILSTRNLCKLSNLWQQNEKYELVSGMTYLQR